MCLSAGPNGQGGTGGHGHNDKNSVELSFGSFDVLVDRGTYVYARDPQERNARRGTAGHNTVQVDGLEQNRIIPGRLFALPDTARAGIAAMERRDGFDLAAGEHRGYERSGIVHRRVAALREDCAAFVDELRGRGEHLFQSRWYVPQESVVQRRATAEEKDRLAWVTTLHVLPNGNIIVGNCHAGPENPQLIEVTRDKKVVWQFKDHKNFGNSFAAWQILEALFAFGATLPWDLSLLSSDVSPGYAEKKPARCIRIDAAGAAPARLFTAVLFLRKR